MAGLGENINENKLKEATKEQQIKEVVRDIKPEVDNNYLETLKTLTGPQVASLIEKAYQNIDGTWKKNSEIDKTSSFYALAQQAAFFHIYGDIGLLGNSKIDAEIGPATRNAVAKFQQENRLQVDGDAGPQTLAAMCAKLKGQEIGDNIKKFYTDKAEVLKTAKITQADLPAANVTLELDGSLTVKIVGNKTWKLIPAITPPMNTYTMEGNTGRFAVDNKELYYAGDNKFVKYNIGSTNRDTVPTTKYPKALDGIIGAFPKTTETLNASSINIYDTTNSEVVNALALINSIEVGKKPEIVPVCISNGIIVFAAYEGTITKRFDYNTTTKTIVNKKTYPYGSEAFNNMDSSIASNANMEIELSDLKNIKAESYKQFEKLQTAYNKYWREKTKDGTRNNVDDGVRKDGIWQGQWPDLGKKVGKYDARDIVERATNRDSGKRFIKWGKAIEAKGSTNTSLRDFITFELFRPSGKPWNEII